nr:unnamed protein product [Callosobruchus analis]
MYCMYLLCSKLCTLCTLVRIARNYFVFKAWYSLHVTILYLKLATLCMQLFVFKAWTALHVLKVLLIIHYFRNILFDYAWKLVYWARLGSPLVDVESDLLLRLAVLPVLES